MAKKKKLEITAEDKKQKIYEAFGAIEDSDRLKDKKADTVAVKLDIVDLLKDTIQKQLRKDYDPEAQSRVIINPDRGDFEVYIIRKVVETVEENRIEISLEDMQGIDDSLEVGDEYEEGPIPLEKILSRKSIQIIKQAVQKKVRDAERAALYEEALELIGEVVSAEVYQVHGKETVLRYQTTKDHTIELLMPDSEKMQKDNPRRIEKLRQRIKVFIKTVEREKHRVKLEDGTEIEKEREDGPMKVIASRTDRNFLRKLFEGEVPEISDGIISIKNIVRVPGERAKVAVESSSARIDPVGACVGNKGKRIQSIVKELNNENIDVINFSDEPQIYIARALQPAKIDPMTVHVDTRAKSARVMLKPDQIKYAIGKNGNNIHLAEELTGYEIEIYRDISADDEGDDIDIIAFREEFGDDMIYQLLEAGLDTAKKVRDAGVEAVEKALTAQYRREELPEINALPRRDGKPPFIKIISDEERKHWRKMAENIHRAVSDQFDSEEESEPQDLPADETATEQPAAETHTEEVPTAEAESLTDEVHTEDSPIDKTAQPAAETHTEDSPALNGETAPEEAETATEKNKKTAQASEEKTHEDEAI